MDLINIQALENSVQTNIGSSPFGLSFLGFLVMLKGHNYDLNQTIEAYDAFNYLDYGIKPYPMVISVTSDYFTSLKAALNALVQARCQYGDFSNELSYYEINFIRQSIIHLRPA